MIVLGLGAALVLNGKMSVGTLIAFVVIQNMLHAPVQTLAYGRLAFSTNKPIVDRMLDLFSQEAESSGTTTCDGGELAVLDLRLDIGDRTILERVTFNLRPGEWVAILGENGSGKSVLMQLLPRLIRGHSGNAALGDVALCDAILSDVRAQILVLPQHDTLFSGTIRENVAYGESFVDEDIWRVLDIVELADRVRLDEYALDADVKPIGSELSSGERQRLALARALLRQPALLVVDEAMSSIDFMSEFRILTRIRKSCNQSLIYISHREGNINLFDRVYRLENGHLLSEPGMGRTSRFTAPDRDFVDA